VKESIAPLIFTPGKTAKGSMPHASLFSLARMLHIYEGQLVFDTDGISRPEAQGFNYLVRAERLEDEIGAIKKELTTAFGLRGRTRKGADPNERARKTISKAVGRTLAHIQKDDLDLWRHLQKALELGLTSSYNPHPLVNWTT
jgi:hypothetical protein